MIRVMIADDQELFNELLGHMLAKADDIEVVARVYNGKAAVEQSAIYQPDILLMDLSMPICDGIDAVKQIREKGLRFRIIILTSSKEGEDVREAMEAGADGYMLKSITKERLLLAIRSVHSGMEVVDGDVYANVKRTRGHGVQIDGVMIELSERDIQIMEMVVEGKQTAEMASLLFISEGRVRNIITELIAKLMLQDRTQLAVFALRNRIVKL